MNLVFVYGTLKKDFGNHYLIGDKPVNRFVDNDKIYGYAMYSHGGFPFIVNDTVSDNAVIKGEIYEVDDETLALLDRLEGHPKWYLRSTAITDQGTKVQVYVMPTAYLKQSHRKYEQISSGDWQ